LLKVMFLYIVIKSIIYYYYYAVELGEY